MIKKSCTIILFLFLIPGVLSLTKDELITGWVEDGQSITEKDIDFSFQVAQEGWVLIRHGIRSTLVKKNECKYQDNLHFCVGEINFSYKNHTTWRNIYKADLDIWIIKGELDFSRSIKDPYLLIGETTEIEVTMENTGSRLIENVSLRDYYPEEFKISGITGCSLNNKTIEYNGDIPKKLKKTCSYKLTALDAVSYDSEPSVTYLDGVSQTSFDTTSTTIEIQNYSLQIKPEFNQERYEIGDIIYLNITLENINPDEDVYIQNLKIKIPEEFELLDKDKELEENSDNTILTWNGRLDEGQAKKFEFEFLVKTKGNYTIDIEQRYKVDLFTREITTPIKIDVICECLSINYNIPQKITPGEDIDLKIFLKNPSEKNQFDRIEIKTSTNIPDAKALSKIHPAIYEKQTFMLFNEPVKVPSQGSYYYDVNIAYKSEYGEHFTQAKKILLSKEGIEVEEEKAINFTLANETKEIQENSKQEQKQAKKQKKFDFNLKIFENKRVLTMAGIFIAVLLAIGFLIGMIRLGKEKKSGFSSEEKTLEENNQQNI